MKIDRIWKVFWRNLIRRSWILYLNLNEITVIIINHTWILKQMHPARLLPPNYQYVLLIHLMMKEIWNQTLNSNQCINLTMLKTRKNRKSRSTWFLKELKRSKKILLIKYLKECKDCHCLIATLALQNKLVWRFHLDKNIIKTLMRKSKETVRLIWTVD